MALACVRSFSSFVWACNANSLSDSALIWNASARDRQLRHWEPLPYQPERHRFGDMSIRSTSTVFDTESASAAARSKPETQAAPPRVATFIRRCPLSRS